jgi:hypothetical protein
MKTAIELLLLAAITLSIKAIAQETPNPLRNASSCEVANRIENILLTPPVSGQ